MKVYFLRYCNRGMAHYSAYNGDIDAFYQQNGTESMSVAVWSRDWDASFTRQGFYRLI